MTLYQRLCIRYPEHYCNHLHNRMLAVVDCRVPRSYCKQTDSPITSKNVSSRLRTSSSLVITCDPGELFNYHNNFDQQMNIELQVYEYEYEVPFYS